MLRLRNRQIVLFALLLATLFLVKYCLLAVRPFLLVQLFHLQWKYHHVMVSMGAAGLLTKRPLVQLVDEKTIDLVFESRHLPSIPGSSDLPTATVFWSTGDGQRNLAVATMVHDEMETFVYRARISKASIASSAFLYHIEIGTWVFKPAVLDLSALLQTKRSLKIGVLGDNQFAAVRYSKVLAQMVATVGQMDAMIHVGDAVQDAASARAWSTDFWSPVEHYNLLDLPWILLRGNHDAPSVYTSTPRSTGNIAYTSILLQRSSTFIVVLDSNTDSELQDRFLEAELKSDRAQAASRRLVLVHIPPYVEYWSPKPWRKGENLWGQFVRTKWVPIFEAQHVDLVISGHQHNYQRAHNNGITYLVVGGAGGTLDHERVEDHKLQHVVTIVQHHFGVLELDEQAGIRWKAYLSDGTLADDLII